MRYAFKTILATVVLTGVLASLILGTVVFLSAPSRGRHLAESLGIPHPAIIAHRGASYLAPEGTRPAYLLAREMGADYLELDLQRTRDGVLIVLHDSDLRRTTNVAEVFPGREMESVDKFTFAELQKLDAGSWFNTQFPDRARASFKNVRILRLEDVIDIAEGASYKLGLYIETKAAGRFPGIERQLVETLTARGLINLQHNPPSGPKPSGAGGTTNPARVIFQSFEADSLALLKKLAPQVPAVLLIDETMMSTEGWESLLRKAKRLGAGIGTWGYRWSRNPDWSVKDAPRRYLTTWPWLTGQAHRAGLLVHPWTIDDLWEMWTVFLFGADGLFTNRSEVAIVFYGRAEHLDLKSLWQRTGY
jgi:glycerophosphoryl diester phosphodiesterase